ncbi:MAG: bifunctional hydroxymethylpyrimidine kinase/phosphomethylpyrimidine kinase [Solirubrobacterales bacterium]|nr:MAG: bifunctional hydroxymethylpyrimidine kinase/phosphomethylpyrimidine kinase [Solirubrobacterales bacterium]
MDPRHHIPRVLSIAGSDSGGGAGIQADLKAFAACGVHGMTAITAITAQSTVGVSAVHSIPPEVILAQVRAVSADIGIDAVKIGMLGDTATIEAVAQAIGELPVGTPIVVDPVMVAESGAELLAPPARASLIELLLSRATVATPNLAEARALVAEGDAGADPGADDPGADGDPGADSNSSVEGDAGAGGEGEVAFLARAVYALGPQAVVVTGGHREHATDVFFDGSDVVQLPGDRHPGGDAHGSGCTHSSVLAARLAWGDRPLQAARHAKTLAARAVASGLGEIGAGPGPVDVLGIAGRR